MKHQAEPRTILVGMLLPIGDTLLTTPVLAALRRRYPQASITVLVSRANVGILKDNPSFDHTIMLFDKRAPENKASDALQALRALRTLRSVRYDLVITLSPISTFMLRLAGITQPLMGLDMPMLWWLVGTRSLTYRTRHAADHYARAIAPLLRRPLNDVERRPRIYLKAHDRAAAQEKLRAWKIDAATPLITMHVGGKGFNGRKRWAPERFAIVANALIERFDAQVVLIGGGEDRARSEQVAAAIGRNVRVAAGETSLKESSALIERSTLFIGNDSCPLHIAAAVNTPAVGIFGPSNHIQFTPIGGKNARQRMLHSTVPCSPCYRFLGNEPPWIPNLCYSYACLKAISPDAVLQAAMELLEEPATVPQALTHS